MGSVRSRYITGRNGPIRGTRIQIWLRVPARRQMHAGAARVSSLPQVLRLGPDSLLILVLYVAGIADIVVISQSAT